MFKFSLLLPLRKEALSHHATDLQNCLGWKGSVKTMGWDTSNLIMLSKSPSKPALKMLNDGPCTTSLGITEKYRQMTFKYIAYKNLFDTICSDMYTVVKNYITQGRKQ